MRRMRSIRVAAGLSLKKLSKLTGVNCESIRKHELNEKTICKKNQLKIAQILGVTIDELNADDSENKSTSGFKCLNEKCLLNKNKFCDNPVVLSGRSICHGRDKV